MTSKVTVPKMVAIEMMPPEVMTIERVISKMAAIKAIKPIESVKSIKMIEAIKTVKPIKAPKPERVAIKMMISEVVAPPGVVSNA